MVVAEWVGLEQGMGTGGFVHAGRRAVQEGGRTRAVGHQQAGGLGVGPQIHVPASGLDHREVHDQVDVVGNDREVGVGQIDRNALDAVAFERGPLGRITESRQPDHVVVGRECSGHRPRDLPGRAGDEDASITELVCHGGNVLGATPLHEVT